MIGKVVFSSGGLTTVLHTTIYNNLRVSDTPGLNDSETKQKAAEEICKGGLTKLVFVWTTNAGRVTAEQK